MLLTPAARLPPSRTGHSFDQVRSSRSPRASMADVGEDVRSGPAGTTSDAQRLQRAKGYPYSRPASSFVYLNGQAQTFPDSHWASPQDLSHLQLDKPDATADPFLSHSAAALREALESCGTKWTPVLGIGSNAAPEQLKRKFPKSMFSSVVIPVVRCVLVDYDVIYAPLIAGYGSCTATVERSPGTMVEVWLTYLQPELLLRMHATEGAYDLLQLQEINLHVGSSVPVCSNGGEPALKMDQVLVYIATNGSLCMSPTDPPGPIALQDVPAAGRTFTARSQTQMLALLQSQLCQADTSGKKRKAGDDCSSMTLDAWILRNIAEITQRQQYTAAMVARAQPFQGPKFQLMEELNVDSHVE